jgi:hypothetical protein
MLPAWPTDYIPVVVPLGERGLKPKKGGGYAALIGMTFLATSSYSAIWLKFR